MAALGFGRFGLNPAVFHRYVPLVSVGNPGKLAGVEIQPGELIHADRHGVCLIPVDVAHRVAQGAAARSRRWSGPCSSIAARTGSTLEEYIKLRAAAKTRRIREVTALGSAVPCAFSGKSQGTAWGKAI